MSWAESIRERAEDDAFDLALEHGIIRQYGATLYDPPDWSGDVECTSVTAIGNGAYRVTVATDDGTLLLDRTYAVEGGFGDDGTHAGIVIDETHYEIEGAPE